MYVILELGWTRDYTRDASQSKIYKFTFESFENVTTPVTCRDVIK